MRAAYDEVARVMSDMRALAIPFGVLTATVPY